MIPAASALHTPQDIEQDALRVKPKFTPRRLTGPEKTGYQDGVWLGIRPYGFWFISSVLINARHCRAKRSNLLEKSLLPGIASAKTPRPVKYWPKASAVKRHLTGRAMTGEVDSLLEKQSFFIDHTDSG